MRKIILFTLCLISNRYPQIYALAPISQYPVIFSWVAENVNCEALPYLGNQVWPTQVFQFIIFMHFQEESLVVSAYELMLTSISGTKTPANLQVFVDAGGIKCVADTLYCFTFWKRQRVVYERMEKVQVMCLDILQKCLVVPNFVNFMVCIHLWNFE